MARANTIVEQILAQKKSLFNWRNRPLRFVLNLWLWHADCLLLLWFCCRCCCYWWWRWFIGIFHSQRWVRFITLIDHLFTTKIKIRIFSMMIQNKKQVKSKLNLKILVFFWKLYWRVPKLTNKTYDEEISWDVRCSCWKYDCCERWAFKYLGNSSSWLWI